MPQRGREGWRGASVGRAQTSIAELLQPLRGRRRPVRDGVGVLGDRLPDREPEFLPGRRAEFLQRFVAQFRFFRRDVLVLDQQEVPRPAIGMYVQIPRRQPGLPVRFVVLRDQLEKLDVLAWRDVVDLDHLLVGACRGDPGGGERGGEQELAEFHGAILLGWK